MTSLPGDGSASGGNQHGVGHKVEDLDDFHIKLIMPNDVRQAVDAIVTHRANEFCARGPELVGLDTGGFQPEGPIFGHG